MLGADVDEMDVEAVDVGDELRQGIQLRFRLAPVVGRSPVANQRLQFRELDALRLVTDRLPIGPARGGDASAQIGEVFRRGH